MGIIRAFGSAIGGALADTWQEVIEAGNMSDTTVCCSGVTVRKNDRRNSNRKGTADTISNGSIIHVGEAQCMLLIDGGKVIDFTAEPGYYKVDNSSLPSLFAGQFGDSLKEAFARIKYGGVTPTKQKAIFINMQEIKGIKFGTRTPVQYFDNFYNSELFLRAFGTYSIKIVNPVQFYAQAIPKNEDYVDINRINEQYLDEFLQALQTSLNLLSAEGMRISFVTSKATELSRHMAEVLDEEWRANRGMEIQSVGLASINYDDESKKLINMRNQGAMLGDAAVREGYVQGAMARGMEAAGSNSNGAATAFMGMGMGMGAGAGFMNSASETNRRQMEMQAEQRKADAASAAAAAGWSCACGNGGNTGKFCSECGKPKPAAEGWTCSCGQTNTGKFCQNCGSPRPASGKWTCSCGTENEGKFCQNCGNPRG